MGKHSFNPHDCIAKLNNIKRAMQMAERPFSKESILKQLKSCGLPTNARFWSVFRKSGILQETSKGYFMFASKEPIFVGELTRIKAKYRELTKKAEVLPEICEEKPIKNIEESEIQLAINLLKGKGYLVLAPTGIVYTPI